MALIMHHLRGWQNSHVKSIAFAIAKIAAQIVVARVARTFEHHDASSPKAS
jgi:hypothetical protein